MKKILILVDKVGPKKELFAELVAKRLSGKNVQIALGRFSDLYFELDSDNTIVNIEDKPITDFDLVYFRRAGDKFSVLAGTLAFCLKRLGVKFIDSSWDSIGPLGSKFTSLVKLAGSGLPIFHTIYVWQSNIENYQRKLVDKLGLPLVAKELSTQRGKGVYLINSLADFSILPRLDSKKKDNQYMFQKFIEIASEYRILVLGDKSRVWEKKVVTKKGEFRHNIALGASEEFLPIAKIPDNISKIATQAASLLGLEIAGVDVAIEGKTGKAFLVEVNRGPGITYDTTLSPEIDEIAKFLGKEAKANK